MSEHHMTQGDVAKAIGKSNNTVSRMLAGLPGSPIRNEYIPKLAALFGVPADYFVTDESNTDAIRLGTPPEKEEGPSSYDLQCKVQELNDRVKQLTESREYYFNLSNELAKEKQELQSGENLDIENIKEICTKQLKMSIALMKAVTELLEEA